MWHGVVAISCSKNNYVAQIHLSEEDSRNVIEGEILDGGVIIYKLSGIAGKETVITDVTKENEEEREFVDISTYKDNPIVYLPEEVQSEFHSLRLWQNVKQAIIRNDMAAADEEKKKIEADQRIRQKTRLATGTWKDAQHFIFHSKKAEDEELTEEEELERGNWEFKQNISIDQEYITSMFKEAEQIRERRAAEKASFVIDEVTDETDTPPEESNDTCSVQ